MIQGARQLSAAATKDWHGGEDEMNPRFLEPMRLAVEQKQAQRELEIAKAEKISAYGKAWGSLLAVGTFVLGAFFFALGSVIGARFGLPTLGGSALSVLAIVGFTINQPAKWVRLYLKAAENENTHRELAQFAIDAVNEKQRQLDEGIKVIEPVEVPRPPTEKLAEERVA